MMDTHFIHNRWNFTGYGGVFHSPLKLLVIVDKAILDPPDPEISCYAGTQADHVLFNTQWKLDHSVPYLCPYVSLFPQLIKSYGGSSGRGR